MRGQGWFGKGQSDLQTQVAGKEEVSLFCTSWPDLTHTFIQQIFIKRLFVQGTSGEGGLRPGPRPPAPPRPAPSCRAVCFRKVVLAAPPTGGPVAQASPW